MKLVRDIIETSLRAWGIDANCGEVDRAVLLATDSGEIAYAGHVRAVDLIAYALRNTFEAFGRH